MPPLAHCRQGEREEGEEAQAHCRQGEREEGEEAQAHCRQNKGRKSGPHWLTATRTGGGEGGGTGSLRAPKPPLHIVPPPCAPSPPPHRSVPRSPRCLPLGLSPPVTPLPAPPPSLTAMCLVHHDACEAAAEMQLNSGQEDATEEHQARIYRRFI